MKRRKGGGAKWEWSNGLHPAAPPSPFSKVRIESFDSEGEWQDPATPPLSLPHTFSTAACPSTKKVCAVVQPNGKTAIKTVLLCVSTSIHPSIHLSIFYTRFLLHWGFITTFKHWKTTVLSSWLLCINMISTNNKKMEQTFGWSKVFIHQARRSIPDCWVVCKTKYRIKVIKAFVHLQQSNLH